MARPHSARVDSRRAAIALEALHDRGERAANTRADHSVASIELLFPQNLASTVAAAAFSSRYELHTPSVPHSLQPPPPVAEPRAGERRIFGARRFRRSADAYSTANGGAVLPRPSSA